MADFSQRLREELEYTDLLPEELAARAGIQKYTLDMYLEVQKSMPPADVAFKIASALGVSVERLITGHTGSCKDMAKYLKFRDVLGDLLVLPETVYKPIKIMITALARQEREGKTHLS